MTAFDNMAVEELKELLRKLQANLEDVEEERYFALSQSGHIHERLSKEWERDIAHFNEQIRLVEEELERRKSGGAG